MNVWEKFGLVEGKKVSIPDKGNNDEPQSLIQNDRWIVEKSPFEKLPQTKEYNMDLIFRRMKKAKSTPEKEEIEGGKN